MQDHVAKLDAIRGLSALAVLAGHAARAFLTPVLGAKHVVPILAGNLARHAVLVFFLLSGYLISHSILANIRRNGTFKVADYLEARLSRIYPPLIGAIVLTLAIGWVLQALGLANYDDGAIRASYSASFYEGIKALAMADGLLGANGPLWTLYIEVHLYVVAMLLALAFVRRSLLWAGAGAVLLTYYLGQTVEFALFACVWALGAVAAVFPQHLRLVRWLGAVCAVVMIGIGFYDPAKLNFQHERLGGPTQLVFSLAYLWLVLLSPRLWRRPPAWAVRSAEFSYSLYVLHFPLLLLAVAVGKGMNPWACAALACVACVLIAALFARFFEDQRRFRPFIRRALQAGAP